MGQFLGYYASRSKTDCLSLAMKGKVIVVNRATEKRVDFDISKIQGRNVREIVTAGFYDKSVALEVLEKKQPAFQFSGIMIVSVSFL